MLRRLSTELLRRFGRSLVNILAFVSEFIRFGENKALFSPPLIYLLFGDAGMLYACVLPESSFVHINGSEFGDTGSLDIVF